MTKREELIKELQNKTFLQDDYDCVEECADFIIKDRIATLESVPAGLFDSRPYIQKMIVEIKEER